MTILDKFIFAKGLKNEQEIRENPQLKYHATKISQIFATRINQLDNINTASLDEIQNLGQNHFGYDVRLEDFEVEEI